MRLVFNLVGGLLLLLFLERMEGTTGCKESNATAKKVLKCPQTEKEWKVAAAKKNCGSITNSCSSFVYHCVINAWGNENIEVCAPRLNIVGGNCAEYNFGGSRIQRNEKVVCTLCPLSYDSTESFHYLECYNYTKTALKLTTAEATSPSAITDVSTGETNYVTLPILTNYNIQRQHNNLSGFIDDNVIIFICFGVAIVVVLVFILTLRRTIRTNKIFIQLKRLCAEGKSQELPEESQDNSDTADFKTLLTKTPDVASTENRKRSTDYPVNSVV